MTRLAALLLLLAAPSFAQKRLVTIEAAAASAPRSGFEEVVWAPDGQRFAYKQSGAIWEYQAASGHKRELVSLAALSAKAAPTPAQQTASWQNRGLREQEFQWSSSGRDMLIAAGGDLFLLHLATGSWDQLTATPEAEHDPKLSPDGGAVSFRRGHDLYCLEIASRHETRLTHDGSSTLFNAELDWVYPEELALGTAHWWSPDSRRIAFLQFDVSRELVYPHLDLLASPPRYEPQRFPVPGTPNAQVRLGVLSREGGPVRWIDFGGPADALLARVHWSPDGRTLGVERLNRIQNRLDLHMADAVTGAVRLVLHEEDPYWVNLNDDFRFLDQGRQFLWGSERDGWHHLYLYTAEGKQVARLTQGEWEVTEVAGVDEAARQVWFLSTEPSPLERQLYRVRLDGKHKQRLTKAPGTHVVSMGPSCAYFLDAASSLTDPVRRAVHRAGGAEVAECLPASRPSYDLLPVEIVRVKTSDGAVLYAKLIRPDGFTGGKKYPAIVIVYGGPHAQNVRDAWSGVTWEQALAARGFVVWQLDNRGTAGRGHYWETRVFRNLGAQELRDQEEGVRYLVSLGFVDSARIGIHGWSYGGFMTLYALLHAPRLFRVGVAGAPVTDWRNYDTIYTERYMGLPDQDAQAYQHASLPGKAADLEAPLLLVHNFEDDNVHLQNTMQMANALERAGKQFRMVLYPQKTHGVTTPFRQQLLETMTAFFEQYLKN